MFTIVDIFLVTEHSSTMAFSILDNSGGIHCDKSSVRGVGFRRRTVVEQFYTGSKEAARGRSNDQPLGQC